ncbi:hypothetical protein [Campylobacter corcagiensis]|uniref:Uncharacterized protein n=1 Tax=Campylobacter corcagiensis TaxID=1448857 RepID=A0A7M1LF83_9BACT|nr:hypothetical protein [Campylobacter corcagiensis]QKF64746.1 putative membrane protein [Campylobacter corcagiensis]QOQ87090.1 hypothetical protein IMC76_07715 [Campylobacter corcagiensis]
MNLIIKAIFYALCGSIFGLILDAVGSLSVWFEMRVHIWQILFFSIFIWVLAGVFIIKIYPSILYILEILFVIVCAIFDRFHTIYFDIKEIVDFGFSFEIFYLAIATATIAINLTIWRYYGRK